MSGPEQQHKATCNECGSESFLFCKDLNLDKVWKAGNKYCRICTECGFRYFLSKAMYRAATDQYVILDGEDDPIPIFDCPSCEETVTGTPAACPYCDVAYSWPTPEADEAEADEAEADVENAEPEPAAVTD